MISEYNDDDFLLLSGLQHFLFCRRQWALIHVENQWEENLRTVDGRIMHERTHNEELTEHHGDTIITRGMNIFSRRLGVSGKCDVVEFHKSEEGIELYGWKEKWVPFPVEYKRGEPKKNNCDIAQLCGQAMCLEEMLGCHIKEGALFYGETKRRTAVLFSDDLRNLVSTSLIEMHQLYDRGYTPSVKRTKACNACSLATFCIPVLNNAIKTSTYLAGSIEESI